MEKIALGLIEVVGLTAAIEAADAAVKAAGIELTGYELAKGGGMVTVKVSGDVGAVKAAVAAARLAAGQVGTVCWTHVIPRPHAEVGALINSRETVGRTILRTPAAAIIDVDPSATGTDSLPEETEPVSEAAVSQPDITVEQPLLEPPVTEGLTEKGNCNLCGDPECTRKKGDPKVTCIHYNKNNKEDE